MPFYVRQVPTLSPRLYPQPNVIFKMVYKLKHGQTMTHDCLRKAALSLVRGCMKIFQYFKSFKAVFEKAHNAAVISTENQTPLFISLIAEVSVCVCVCVRKREIMREKRE